jgi:hypothetical protein
MYNTAVTSSQNIDSKEINLGSLNGRELAAAYIIEADTYETTIAPYGRDVAPGVYFDFRGAKIVDGEFVGDRTVAMFLTLADAQQFAAAWVAERRENFAAAAA